MPDNAQDLIDIPHEHWGPKHKQYAAFIPGWEKQLRDRMAAQPDPATRFGSWLEMLASGAPGRGQSVTVWFIEQPYLVWAELVQKAIEAAGVELRNEIADDIRNPREYP